MMNLINHVVVLITLRSCSGVIVVPNDNHRMESCLDHILNSLNESTFIYTVDLDLQVNRPVTRFDSKLEPLFWFRMERSEVIVIKLNAKNLDADVLEKMFRHPLFSPRSVFIVIVDQVGRSLFRTASRFYLNQLLVIETNTSFPPNIYTHKPYEAENVNDVSGDFILLGACDGKLQFDFDVPSQWRNTTIQVLNNIIPPYSMCATCQTNPGIEIEALDIIAKHLRFKINYTRDSFDYWGSKINGTYSHILGMLERHEGDMGVGVFHSKFDEHIDFDLTFSYMEDSSKWLVPRARILPYWLRFSLIFTKEVYLSLLCSLVIMVAICHVVYKVAFSTSLLMLYQILFECSLPKLPIKNRSVIIVWISSCLVLSTMFKSKLIDTLSKNSYERQISTLNDITTSGLHIIIDHDIARFYDDYTHPDEAYIQDHYEYCPVPRLCINRTAFVQDCVTIDFQRAHEFFLSEFVDPEGNLLVRLVQKPIFPVHIHLFFVKGYPIFPQINSLLFLLRSNGVIQRLYNNAGHDAIMSISKKTLFHIEVLGLEQMQIAFFIWGVGIFVSCVAFVVEYATDFRGNVKSN